MPRKKNKNTAEKFSELFDDFSFSSRKGMNNFFDDIAKNFDSILKSAIMTNNLDIINVIVNKFV